MAESEGHAVGPILVLSYKNHALDEFLLDIINASGHVFGKPEASIRTGKPDIESLMKFTEKHSPIEKEAQAELSRRLAVLLRARNVGKSFLDSSRVMISAASLQVR